MNNDSLELFISNLQAKVNSLQNQHIAFVSYCSDLINSHIKEISEKLSNETLTRKTPRIIIKQLESLENNYRIATTGIGFSISITNIQEALEVSRVKILKAIKKELNEKEVEKEIFSIFLALAEVIYRKHFKLNRSNSISRSKSPQMTSSQQFMLRDGNLNGLINENNLFHKKVSKLKKKIIELKFQLRLKDKELLESTQKIERNRIVQKSSGKISKDNINFLSVERTPTSSPIISGSFRSNIMSSTSRSSEIPFNVEHFKFKLDSLAYLLDNFANYAAKIELAVNNNPELQNTLSRFKSARNELTFALKEIISPQNSKRKLDCNEEGRLSSNTSDLKAKLNKTIDELRKKNEEITELSEENQKNLEEMEKTKNLISTLKQDVSRYENDNEELRLEIVYSRSQIERYQKNIKILQESLALQENKYKDITILQSKYEEIIKFSNKRSKAALGFSPVFNLLIQSEKVDNSDFKMQNSELFLIENQGFISIESNTLKNNTVLGC